MIAALLFMLATQADPPPDAMNGAIFDDVRLNAWIGNGNALVSLDWVSGPDEAHAPLLRISQRQCARSRRLWHCSFLLTREWENSPISTNPSDRLACTADLKILTEDDGSRAWYVIHTPPHGAGHSRTSMQCRVAD